MAIALCAATLLAAGCAGHRSTSQGDIYGPGPRGYLIGKPYRVNGAWYYPAEDPQYDHIGFASWYGPGFHGDRTANGERYDRRRMTAAHTTLPMPVLVRVTNLQNGRSAILRVNDRGPFVPGRIIDVSEAAANALGFRQHGLARVRVQYVGRADGVPVAGAPRSPFTKRPVPVAGASQSTAALPFGSAEGRADGAEGSQPSSGIVSPSGSERLGEP